LLYKGIKSCCLVVRGRLRAFPRVNRFGAARLQPQHAFQVRQRARVSHRDTDLEQMLQIRERANRAARWIENRFRLLQPQRVQAQHGKIAQSCGVEWLRAQQ